MKREFSEVAEKNHWTWENIIFNKNISLSDVEVDGISATQIDGTAINCIFKN
jgi:hypothetical protein